MFVYFGEVSLVTIEWRFVCFWCVRCVNLQSNVNQCVWKIPWGMGHVYNQTHNIIFIHQSIFHSLMYFFLERCPAFIQWGWYLNQHFYSVASTEESSLQQDTTQLEKAWSHLNLSTEEDWGGICSDQIMLLDDLALHFHWCSRTTLIDYVRREYNNV